MRAGVRSRLLFLFLGILLPVAASAQPQSGFDKGDSFQQGLIALQANQLEAALEAFTTAEQNSPNNARIRNFRGVTLMALGRFSEAATEYERAIQLDDQLEDAYRNLGFLEWSSHNEARAREHLRHALRLAPEDEFAAYYMARVEDETKRYSDAAAVLSPFANKDRIWARFDLALVYVKSGEYEDAFRIAQALISGQLSNDEKAASYSVVGICQAKFHRDEQALFALRQATNLASGHEEHWLNLTRQQMETNHLADAIASAQESLRALPKSYALNLRLGAAYFSAGKYPEAERVFRDLVTAGDPLPLSHIGLAQVLLRTGRAEEATRVLKDAERSIGPQFLILYFQGLAFSRAGNRAASLEAFRQAVKISPESAEAHLGVGKNCLALGQTSEAVTELQTVLKLDASNVPARRLLSQAYSRLGDQTSAAKLTSTANEPTDVEPPSHLVGDFLLAEWMQPN